MSQGLVTLVTNSMCQSSKSFLGPRMPSKTVMILSEGSTGPGGRVNTYS